MYYNLTNNPEDNYANEPTDEELEMIEQSYFLDNDE